jgi:Trypsin
LPTEEIDVDEDEGRNAYAVGWGQDDTGNDSKLKNYAVVQVRSQNTCKSFWNDYLQRDGGKKFFCAAGDGRKSACYRDQPLYLKTNGKWLIRGLISIAMSLPDNTCDLNKPVLYEDVGQYYHWLRSLIL